MRWLFAVFLFIFYLSGCSGHFTSESGDYNIVTSDNIVYKISGDFNGDKKADFIYIFKTPNNIYYLNMNDDVNTFQKQLNFNIDSFSAQADDINHDGKEDLILYVISNDIENVYAFSFTDQIHPIVYPELLYSIVKFKKLNNSYIITCGTFKNIIQSSKNLSLEFYYTDLDYSAKGPFFISEGSITTDKGTVLNAISITYSINPDNDINVNEVKIISYNRIK